MLTISLCSRKVTCLQVSAALTETGLTGEVALADTALFLARVQTSQPPFALLTSEYMSELGIWTEIRRVSPCTQIVLCVLPHTRIDPTSWKQVDLLRPDFLCDLAELPACLTALKTGQFYASALLTAADAYIPVEPLVGWKELTDAERRVVQLIAEVLTGPEIAVRLCKSERTINNQKLTVGQKLGVNGGPGCLTRFIFSHREQILALLA